MTARLAGLLLLVVLPLAGSARAQAPMATDRPGLIGFTPSLVPRGSFQIEAGVPLVSRSTFSYVGEGGGVEGSTMVLNFPTTLRVGLLPRVELRVRSTLYDRLSSSVVTSGDPAAVGDTTFTYRADLDLGAKVSLLPGENGAPAVSLVGFVRLPTGDEGFSVRDPVLNLHAVASFAFPGEAWLTAMAGGEVLNVGNRPWRGMAGVLVRRPFSDRLSAHAETGVRSIEVFGTGVYVGAGAAFLLTPTIQFDAFFDRELGRSSFLTPSLVGVGASARF